MREKICLDKHGVYGFYPASPSTVARQMARAEDPFPPGAIIGGKRYWWKDDVLDWLVRQFGDGGQEAPKSDPPAIGSDPVAGNPDEDRSLMAADPHPP